MPAPPAASPATARSSPRSSAAPANPSTSAARPAPSQRPSAEPWCCATGAAPSPAAPSRPPGATPTTTATGPTADRPPYPIWSCCAPPTTASSTTPTGRSISRVESPNSSRPATSTPINNPPRPHPHRTGREATARTHLTHIDGGSEVPRASGRGRATTPVAARSRRTGVAMRRAGQQRRVGLPSSGRRKQRQAGRPAGEVQWAGPLALVDGDVGALSGTGVDLTWAADLGGGVAHHLAPVGDPAGEAAEGEEDGEHARGEAHGAVDDAGVEVDVGVEPALDEVVVGQRGLLEALGDVEELVVDAELVEDVVGGALDDGGARVVVLVDPVAEAHELDAFLLVLDALDEGVDVAAVVADLLEHLEDGLVRATV